MIVFLNGQFVPAEQALVPITDRGFLLGDGLFETLPVFGGQPFCWPQHRARLEEGARALGITLPFSGAELTRFVGELIRHNHCPEGVLRITLTRGSGARGYSPRGAGPATLAMTLEIGRTIPPGEPERWRVITASGRVPAGDFLARCKHTSRLLNVLARAEAEACGADEALLLNTAGEIVEAAAGNVFGFENGGIITPPVASGALPGIARALVLGLCARLMIAAEIRPLPARPEVFADGMFLTLGTRGVVEISELDGRQLPSNPITRRLRVAYEETVERFRRGGVEELEALAPFPPRA